MPRPFFACAALLFCSAAFAAPPTLTQGVQTAAHADVPQGTAEQRAVADAAAAIDACYHWGGEVGDQSDERNKQIDAGVAQDCPMAKKLAQQAYGQYPKNSVLAAKILELIDLDYFPADLPEKKRICETAAAEFRRQFLESNQSDELFSDECPAEAAKLYGK
ncbi:MAG TPA: hypothetical protein VGT99_12075 [Gammaproteobacteria bacterium]|nr:hypothetical protein [Gammaproteobacteria bacterium]